MRSIIEIYIVDKKLHDLDLPCPDEYADLIFRTEDFNGYWVSECENGYKEIIFFVGGTTFVTPYKEETINGFDKILEL